VTSSGGLADGPAAADEMDRRLLQLPKLDTTPTSQSSKHTSAVESPLMLGCATNENAGPAIIVETPAQMDAPPADDETVATAVLQLKSKALAESEPLQQELGAWEHLTRAFDSFMSPWRPHATWHTTSWI